MNDRQLSRYFHLSEFRDRSGSLPSRGYVVELRRLCADYLEPVRREFGVTTIHSGYRTRLTNRRVGGATRSRHMNLAGAAGAAADFSCESGSPKEWYWFVADLGPGGLGLYPGHVHVDNRPGQLARWYG